jgi:hypothetical protein
MIYLPKTWLSAANQRTIYRQTRRVCGLKILPQEKVHADAKTKKENYIPGYFSVS